MFSEFVQQVNNVPNEFAFFFNPSIILRVGLGSCLSIAD